MSEFSNSPENEKFQEALAKAAARSLDQSVEAIDDLSSYRLKQIRQKVLAEKLDKPTRFGINKHWAVAASLVIAVGLPSVWMLHSGNQLEAEENAFISPELTLDAQDFDDMDMLIAMEESDA